MNYELYVIIFILICIFVIICCLICLVLGHIVWCWDTPKTKVCNGYTASLQPVSCEAVLRQINGSHRLDLVMIRPPGIDHGAFVVSPSTVWYARL
jgi:amino acid transporter